MEVMEIGIIKLLESMRDTAGFVNLILASQIIYIIDSEGLHDKAVESLILCNPKLTNLGTSGEDRFGCIFRNRGPDRAMPVPFMAMRKSTAGNVSAMQELPRMAMKFIWFLIAPIFPVSIFERHRGASTNFSELEEVVRQEKQKSAQEWQSGWNMLTVRN
jgi:hypothetical protein